MCKEESKLFADKYIDDIAEDPKNNYFTGVWKDVCSAVKFKSLLDVGCGNGVFSAGLKHAFNVRLYGVDASAYALEKAKLSGFDEVKMVSDFCSEKLPFGDNEFDMVVCKDVLEHLINPEFLLREINRVLKNNCFLLVHVPNHFSLLGRIRFLFSNDIDTFKYFPEAKRWNFPHIRFFTHGSLTELLHIRNFEVIRDLSYHFPSLKYYRYLPFNNLIANFLIKKSPDQFAEGFTMLTRKVSASERHS